MTHFGHNLAIYRLIHRHFKVLVLKFHFAKFALIKSTQKQARNAGSLDRGNIKIIKQIIQQIFTKYRGDIMKTKMGLHEIYFVLYLWKKGIFIKVCQKEIGHNFEKIIFCKPVPAGQMTKFRPNLAQFWPKRAIFPIYPEKRRNICWSPEA